MERGMATRDRNTDRATIIRCGAGHQVAVLPAGSRLVTRGEHADTVETLTCPGEGAPCGRLVILRSARG